MQSDVTRLGPLTMNMFLFESGLDVDHKNLYS